MLYKLIKEPRIVVGSTYMIILIVLAILAPAIAPHDPTAMNASDILKPPSKKFLLGTDLFGRDILSRILFGSRVSLVISFSSISFAMCIGTLLGMISGYYGSGYEFVIMRTMDVLLSFPPIFLSIAAVSILGPGVYQLILIVGILYIPRFARVVYSHTTSLKQNTYIEAAKAIGCSNFRIMRKCLFPNIRPVLTVQFTFSLAFAILLEAGMSFIGLGVQPPTSSWGAMIADLKNYIFNQPLAVLWPSFAISITILAINLAGDGLQQIFAVE